MSTNEFFDKMQKTAEEGKIFMCQSGSVYDPSTLPDGWIVIHKEVEHYENGDVACPNCEYLLDGPSLNT